ncbi:DUF3347 domain-containing protein [Flavobacterium agrisoli]|uniref:DUF3347 domain-containing protein n=1 Tax=Flavobacterium agrisoli TaxID=2793066 RepID=A0A934PN65_9FLAO|nr:DUF3347 domain-containing protein [Flavobacterium agrisoli]MBK0369950.1 DUF3347 domain-containing protein [Flavobacterium agrisoli]
MKSVLQTAFALSLFFSLAACDAKIKNAKTETAKIYGNCEMCEKTIEKAGNVDQVAAVDWDKETKIATITFDSTLTNKEDILKRIAMSGYDSENHLATNEAYKELTDCCQYERNPKASHTPSSESATTTTPVALSKDNPLSPVYAAYFEVKNALVQTDANTAAAKAKNLVTSIKAVKMSDLEPKVHTEWMKTVKSLEADANTIANAKDIVKQRSAFTTLSPAMYNLMKITKNGAPVYYQYCPMANNGKGGNWLSTEKEIRNPYYGSEMMNCGGVNEVIN